MAEATGTVHFGLLRRHSTLLLCARCLARGLRRAVPQVISHRHRLRSLCEDCATARHRPA